MEECHSHSRLGKEPMVPREYETWRAANLVWTLWRTENYVRQPTPNVGIILTCLSCIPIM